MCVQWSLLNQVLSVLAFSRSLRARVCSGCLRAYVLACLTGPLAYVLIYRVRGVLPCLTCLLVFYPSVLIYLTSLSACVCVCVCVCLCVCVCVFYSSTGKASSVCKISETFLKGTDQQCYVVSIIPGASAKLLHLHFWKCQYYTSGMPTNCRETIWDIWLAKRLYIFMQDTSRPQTKTDEWQRNTKDKEATLI